MQCTGRVGRFDHDQDVCRGRGDLFVRAFRFELTKAQTPAVRERVVAEVETSPALSLCARPGNGSVRTRRIAILSQMASMVRPPPPFIRRWPRIGAVPRYVGARPGHVQSAVDCVAKQCPISCETLIKEGLFG